MTSGRARHGRHLTWGPWCWEGYTSEGAGGTYRIRTRGRRIDYVLFLQVPDAVLLRRIAGRQTCKTCGTTYNIYYFPPKRPEICDECDGKLYQRSDDTMETARHRLGVYFAQTMPLIEYY